MALSLNYLSGIPHFGRISSEGDYDTIVAEPREPVTPEPDPEPTPIYTSPVYATEPVYMAPEQTYVEPEYTAPSYTTEPLYVAPPPPPPQESYVNPDIVLTQEPSPYPTKSAIDPIFATSVMQPYTPYPPLEPTPVQQPTVYVPPSLPPAPDTPPPPFPPPFEQPTAGAHIEPQLPSQVVPTPMPALFVLPTKAKWAIGIFLALAAVIGIRQIARRR